MLRLSQLRDFIDIVDAGSIHGAARRRGVSQPVLTKALRSLEADIGARLVHRTAQGILLTPSGRLLLARATAIHGQLAKAREEIAAVAGNRGGAVAFGVSAAGLVLVTGALSRFRAEYPRSYVRVVEGAPRALLPLLRDERLDFFIGPRPTAPLDAQVRARPLFRLPVVVTGRRDHRLGDSRSLAELADAPWLLFSADGWDESLVGSAFRTAGLPQPASVTQCESYAAAISLLSTTDCLALIPKQHLIDPALRDVLREIRVADRLPELAYAMYARPDNVLTQPATMLMRALSTAARDMMVETRRRRLAARPLPAAR
jgi:LysR family transcriptional regulator, regulator of abg operon